MYILLFLLILPFIGMFYFMTIVKNGEISFTTNSWHFKLLKWMWDVESKRLNNLCPYYWTVVLSIIILPVYCLFKLFFTIGEWYDEKMDIISDKIGLKNRLNKIKIPELHLLDKLQLHSRYDNINNSLTKNNIFTIIWKYGKTIFIYLILLLFISLICFLVNLYYPSIKANTFIIFYFVITLIFVFIFYFITNNYFYRLNVIVFEPIFELFECIGNLLKSLIGIFLILFKIIGLIFEKLKIKYEESCPFINWDDKNNDIDNQLVKK
jgi:hypothetical protein